MRARAGLAVWIPSSILVAAAIVIVWPYFQRISTPLRAGMTRDEVHLALTSDTTHSYSFYSDPNWCSRGMFHLGKLFSYHTWIGYTFDDQSRLTSSHATTRS